jgi:hypothetical protein
MRLRLRRFSRYRPRVLTLLVFVVTAALIVLANLSFDQVSDWFAGFGVRSYGWPLVWHRYVLLVSDFPSTVGWYYSANRLAGNLALWLFLLTTPAVACEWLLRRHRPRLNWSLRTLLVGVGAAAAMCGLFAALRDRADLQNALIAKLQGASGYSARGRNGSISSGLTRFAGKLSARTCREPASFAATDMGKNFSRNWPGFRNCAICGSNAVPKFVTCPTVGFWPSAKHRSLSISAYRT